MKILLTMPTWTDDLGGFSKIGKTRNPQVALGLLYLATLAEDRGHHVEFVDCDVEDVTIPMLIERIRRDSIDLVGLTATSPIFHKAVKAAEEIKKALPEVKTIIGGDHVNIFKGDVFFPCFDFAAFGEAEETWPEFLDRLQSESTDFGDIDGLLWRMPDGTPVQNKPRRLFPDLDKLPLPAIHLSKIDRYRLTFALPKYRNVGPYVSIMMTRGCPFKCTYCSESSAVKYGGDLVSMRFRSPKNIVDEIEHHYRKHNIRHFFFMDSNITLKKRHTIEMCEEIIRRQLPITFEGWTRANLINEELVALMVKAGLIRMSFGIESGDAEIMKIIKKEVPHEAIREAFRLIGKYGIEPACSAMLGNPGETKETVKRTIAFLDSIPEILYTNFSIANPYPGTEMLAWAREGKHGMRLRPGINGEEVRYTRYDDSPIEVNDLSAEDLVRYQALGLIKLHLKPKRFIAAIRMLGVELLVPIFFKMLLKVLKKLPDSLSMAFIKARPHRP
ncbi:MAG: radical SAM protein [Alphaproteobacteria bacterium]|nr:radical SAM protein [Alphaproteobacteria bacterium]